MIKIIYEIHAYASNDIYHLNHNFVLDSDGKFVDADRRDARVFDSEPNLLDYATQEEADKFVRYIKVKFSLVKISFDDTGEYTDYETIDEIHFEVADFYGA